MTSREWRCVLSLLFVAALSLPTAAATTNDELIFRYVIDIGYRRSAFDVHHGE